MRNLPNKGTGAYIRQARVEKNWNLLKTTVPTWLQWWHILIVFPSPIVPPYNLLMQENDGIEASNKANFGNLDNLNEKHFYGTSEMHLYWNSLSPLLWCPRAENMSVGWPRMLEFHLIYKSTF